MSTVTLEPIDAVRESPPPDTRDLGRKFDRRYLAASLVWCTAALLIKPFYAYVDFGAFYSTAIDKILAGAPLDLYAFVARPPGSNLALPLSHPPIWFFFLAPWYGLGHLLGISDFHGQVGFSFGQAWMLVVTLPLDILLCWMTLRLAEGSVRIREPQRFLVFACLLFSPLLWLSSVRFGHNESAMILMVLLAVAAGEGGRPALSGLCWGLALGIKTTAVVPALIYFGWGLGRGRRRATTVSATTAAAAFLLPLVPYFIYRREQVMYALVEFERLRPIGGYVLLKLLPDSTAAGVYSNAFILIVSAALGIALAFRSGRSFIASGGAWGLVLGQVFLLLFGKALYVWYGLAASCFLFLAVAHARRWKGSVPLIALLPSLLLWIIQGGAWVGDRVDSSVRIRSAIWATLVIGIGGLAIRGLFAERRDAIADASGVDPATI